MTGPRSRWRWRRPPITWTPRTADDEATPPVPGLVAVNLNRPHFRTARWWLLAEGVALMVLGIAGLLVRPPRTGTVVSTADWQLALTPIHCWLLITAGLVITLAILRRQLAVAAASFGAVAGIVMFAVGTATLGTPGGGHSTVALWRYHVGDSVLFSVLTAYNLAVLLWLIANALEGPAWIRRSTSTQPPNHHESFTTGPSTDQSSTTSTGGAEHGDL
ncbi:hypothetical protein CIW49_05755 [Mycolicibacterium sp. P1-18]|uniref:hypothetical protein n=1 Tax=Mycolicibacterium sp. P1-18 TaxID=2024615 RepID=UPI0011F14916|nr:hypothetical protein [Mycolicibacterium sp. P1-18]KAA0101020.1 hypothetical protein CIW49_05755 [Mycolicibacterium sp. P1-18]